MKRCPACAEKIQDAARVCRFCGHQLTDEELKAKSGSAFLIGLGTVIGGCVLLAMCNAGGDNRSTSGQSRQAVSCDLAAAQRLLETLRQNDFILSTTTNGVAVDERQWRELSLGQRRGVAMAVACDRERGIAEPGAYVSIRASDGTTIIASGLPFGGSFSDKE